MQIKLVEVGGRKIRFPVTPDPCQATEGFVELFRKKHTTSAILLPFTTTRSSPIHDNAGDNSGNAQYRQPYRLRRAPRPPLRRRSLWPLISIKVLQIEQKSVGRTARTE